MCGNTLKLIRSYFSNGTQRVQIDNILSDFANISCRVPQGSVLGLFFWYLLSLCAILMYHIHTIKQVAESLLRKKPHSEDSTKQKQQNSHAFPDG